MNRTQLMLEEWQYERLRALAEEQGKSLSALVREIVADHLGRRARRRRSRLADVEGVAEGPPDLGREHDRYLYGPSDAR